MEKTKTCEFDECEVIFTYEPNPKYPDKRKYCDTHSAIVKASYKSFKAAGESEPTHQPIPKGDGACSVCGGLGCPNCDARKVQVEKIGYKEQMYEDAPTSSKPKEQIYGVEGKVTLGTQKAVNGTKAKEEYEIGKRRVRSYALASAIEMLNSNYGNSELTFDNDSVIELAKAFEEYILGEEKKE